MIPDKLKLDYQKVNECLENFNSSQLNITIIFSKCCGHHFSQLFLENEKIKDLYTRIKYYYETVPNIKLYYYDRNQEKKELVQMEEKIKTFFIRNSKPVLDYPHKIYYQVIIGGLCDNDSC
jgi:hypothetical protein